jgi:hypothetical protein
VKTPKNARYVQAPETEVQIKYDQTFKKRDIKDKITNNSNETKLYEVKFLCTQ